MQGRPRGRDLLPGPGRRRDPYGPGPRGGSQFRNGKGYRRSGNPPPRMSRSGTAFLPPPPPPPMPPPPPPRKIDILMQAGRLAAEYLVHKGVLPPSSLPARPAEAWSGGGEDDARKRGRRGSVLDRIGGEALDVGPEKRGYDDNCEYNKMGRRTRRRVWQYKEDEGSDWAKGEERSRSWNERSRNFDDRRYGAEEAGVPPGQTVRLRSFNDNGHREDVDSFPVGRGRDIFYDDRGPRASKAAGGIEFSSNNEVTPEESGSEMRNCDLPEDTLSKASSPSSIKNSAPEDNVNMKDLERGVKASGREIGEVEVEENGSVVGRKHEMDEDSPKVDNLTEVEQEGEQHSDIPSFDFMNVPTKPRTPMARRAMKVAPHSTENGKACKSEETEEFEMADNNIVVPDQENLVHNSSTKFCSNDSKAGIDDGFSYSTAETSPVQCAQPESNSIDPNSTLADRKAYNRSLSFMEISSSVQTEGKFYNKSHSFPERSPLIRHIESNEIIPTSGLLRTDLDTVMNQNLPAEDTSNKVKGSIGSSSLAFAKNMYDCSFTAKETANIIAEKKIVDMDSFQGTEVGSEMKLEHEKKLMPSSFNFFDLNLMETSEITEIPDDPILDEIPGSMAATEVENVSTMDFDIPEDQNQNNTNFYIQESSNKMIPIIDLEDDDDSAEDGARDIPKPKNETMFSTLENFLNHTETAADIPDIQHGYNLATPDYLGSDITSCLSVPAGIHSPQPGVTLNGAEGIPVDEDSIYVSLGEIPIDFMDVWDPPPQYGKYF